MVRIDSHQHFWSVQRGDCSWLTPDNPVLYRDYQPEDLQPLLKAATIDKSILVQGAESVSETDYLLDLADSTSFVAGVVGWVDLLSPSASVDIARLTKRSKLVALRPMLQDMQDERWLLRAELAPALRSMGTHGLRLDALIRPRHLAALTEFVDLHPELPVVIDHCAKPQIANGAFSSWERNIRSVAQRPHVYCKLSGIANEAGRVWDVDSLRFYVDVILESFGARRVMWGSDWPMILLAGTYARWFEAAQQLTKHLCSRDREYIFGCAAAQFYGVAHD